MIENRNKLGQIIGKPILSKICPNCKKIFKTYFSQNRKHCSRSCYWQSMSKFYFGKNASGWKGGKVKHIGGYIAIRKNKTYILEHRLIVEKYLGRSLKSVEQIHHINGIKTDNRLKNLYLFNSISEHRKIDNKWHKIKLTSNLV